MSYYDDHINAVAKRTAERWINEKAERKRLKQYGWLDNEIDIIIAKAKGILKND